MTTKVIFNIDKKLKKAAMKKAERQGLSLSAVLNITTRAFVEDEIKVSAFDRMLAEAREEMRQGKGIPAAEAYRKLGIKK